MNKDIKITLVLPGMLVAVVLLSGCVEEVSDYEIETSSPTPQPTVTPTSTPCPTPASEATPMLSPTTTQEVTPPVLLKKEIHQEIDTTPALAYLLYPSISNITSEDIGFEVTLTDDVHSLSDIGKPSVPYIIKVFKISGNSEVESVSVNLSKPLELYNVFIEPAPPPVTGGTRDHLQNYTTPSYIDNETYASHEPYPGREYAYHEAVEIDLDTHLQVKTVTVHIFPIQYFPAESRILAYRNASISISYYVPAQEGCS